MLDNGCNIVTEITYTNNFFLINQILIVYWIKIN